MRLLKEAHPWKRIKDEGGRIKQDFSSAIDFGPHGSSLTYCPPRIPGPCERPRNRVIQPSVIDRNNSSSGVATRSATMLDSVQVPGRRYLDMSRRETENDHELVTETKKKLKKPPLYKVLLHNDDYTTKEFVVQVLQYVFHKEHTEAVQIMLHVHKKGIGVAGVYSYEIAETKVALVENLAKQHEYPLKCTMEEA
jgi:ATP-dependent Clp protease adaptor protein ClpS